MKILTLCLGAILLAISNPSVVAQHSAHISAEITNPKADYAILQCYIDFHPGTYDTLVIENGIISTDLKIEVPTYYWLHLGREHTKIFVRPGDSIKLKVDHHRFKHTLNFSGSSKAENQLLAFELFHKYERLLRAFDAKTELANYDSLLQEQFTLLNTYQLAHPELDPVFMLKEKQKYLYQTAGWLLNSARSYSWNKPFEYRDSILQIFSTMVDTIRLDNPAMVDIDLYLTFAQHKINRIHEKLVHQGKASQSVLAKHQIVLDSIQTPILRDRLIYRFSDLRDHSDAAQDSIMVLVNRTVEYPLIRGKLNEAYQEWQHLRQGASAPEWTAIDTTGKTYGLADFKGNWVYLDVWNKRCSICIQTMPYLKKLEEEMAGQNISFVSVNTDDSIDFLKSLYSKQALSDYQLFIPTAKTAQFKRDYMIEGAPNIFLIDPEGKIYRRNVAHPFDKPGLKELMAEIGLEL